jgi:hypothetical protein
MRDTIKAIETRFVGNSVIVVLTNGSGMRTPVIKSSNLGLYNLHTQAGLTELWEKSA